MAFLAGTPVVAHTQQKPSPASPQESPLKHRQDEPPRPALPAPPAPLQAPASLDAARTPNGDVVYQALRQRTASGLSFKVKDAVLRRDAGEFHFTDGTITLFSQVSGRETGAVFTGHGVFHLDPPSAMERHQLKLVMKSEVLDQPFTSAVFEFTDDTAAELQAASAGAVTGVNATGAAGETQSLFRKQIKYNIEQRLLADVRQGRKGGFFFANLKGPLFSKRLLYFVDPNGAFGVSPEEVGLLTSSSESLSYDITLGFHSAAQRALAQPAPNAAFGIDQQTLDTTIASNGLLNGRATALVKAYADVDVLPLQLFPSLRAFGAWDAKGAALDFIQEDKQRDADFAVVLPRTLHKGETMVLTTAYSGKDAVDNLGGGNYAIAGDAREDWYPNVRGDFGNYAFYNMTFHTPADEEIIATGDRTRTATEGKLRVSEWQSPVPIPVAGFNMGQFRSAVSERNADVQVIAYANENASDATQQLSQHILGGAMNTTGMLKRAQSEADAAVQIYTDFFGPLQYDRLAVTQQSACTYGQSWPMLVYLPICYFWDSTIQHQLGVLDADPTYWKVVAAHEVAHQWWGHTVGFNSYRDQWMSEGFADFSASLFLLETNKDKMKSYRDFWALERRRLLEKNAGGMRPVDVGPVVMGARLSTSRAGGGVYQSLVYPKGAFILHMLEMLYYTTQYGEGPFKAAMHNFVDAYRNRSATTEDFKAAIERGMPPWMDIEHNHRLDWFFNAYVYGTEVPSYKISATFYDKDGETYTDMTLEQSGVSPAFRMCVPIYIELENKDVVVLTRATITGSKTIQQTMKLGKLTVAPKRVLVNYNYDLLSASDDR